MNKTTTTILQFGIVIIGLLVLAGLLYEPQVEGVNANATFFEIYFQDPFLAYVYLGSIPFFFALYQGIKFLGYMGANQTFSKGAVRAVRTIKYCAFTTAAAILGALVFIKMFAPPGEDSAGALMLGMVATVATLLVAAGTIVLGKNLQMAQR